MVTQFSVILCRYVLSKFVIFNFQQEKQHLIRPMAKHFSGSGKIKIVIGLKV